MLDRLVAQGVHQRRLFVIDFVPKAAPGLAPAGDRLSCSRKKVGKEALPAAPALRATLAAEGPPGRWLNSLLALRAWIPLRGAASDNATGLPPANLPRSAGQRGMRAVARGEP